jgi:hypothetical protein
MSATTTTELVRDSGISVIASDIPVSMTLAQYRKRTQVAPATPWKHPLRLLRGHR